MIESFGRKIYGLADPRTQELRYVGFTTKSLETRLTQHIAAAKRPGKTYLKTWIKSVGLPIIFEIETIPTNELWQEAEKFHIAYFRSIGCNLVNGTIGGEGFVGGRHRPESKEKCRQTNLQKPNHGFPIKNRQKGNQWWADGNRPVGWKENISKGRKGKGLHPGINYNVGNPYWLGKTRSQETKDNISVTKKLQMQNVQARIVMGKVGLKGACTRWYVGRNKNCICNYHREI